MISCRVLLRLLRVFQVLFACGNISCLGILGFRMISALFSVPTFFGPSLMLSRRFPPWGSSGFSSWHSFTTPQLAAELMEMLAGQPGLRRDSTSDSSPRRFSSGRRLDRRVLDSGQPRIYFFQDFLFYGQLHRQLASFAHNWAASSACGFGASCGASWTGGTISKSISELPQLHVAFSRHVFSRTFQLHSPFRAAWFFSR